MVSCKNSKKNELDGCKNLISMQIGNFQNYPCNYVIV
jgi:hypothetical protein